MALLETKKFIESVNSRMIHIEPGLVIIESSEQIFDALMKREFSMIREVGVSLLAIENVESKDSLMKTLSDLRDLLCLSGEVMIREIGVKKINLEPREVISTLKSCDLGDVHTSIIIGNIVIIGRAFYRRSMDRLPKIMLDESATMKIIDMKFMNNLIHESRHGVVYDPFGGAGYLLFDFCAKGQRILLSDIDPRKIRKAIENFDRNNCDDYDIFQADALNIPIRSDAVSSIVTDIPYGRRSRIITKEERNIFVKLVSELLRVVSSRGSIVMALSFDQWKVLRDQFIDNKYLRNAVLQHLHSNLHRVYMVLEKRDET